MTVTATYRLRLRLPDQPGALGRLASALGDAGADIESIVVVDRAEGYAVDDLLVGLPVGTLADRLVTAACSVPGVTVEAVQRHHGRMRVHDELELLDAAASSGEPLLTLVNGLPELLHASYAMVVGVAPALSSPSAPSVAVREDWLPLDAPRPVSPGDLWNDPDSAGPDCALVAAPFHGGALVLGRIGGPEFRPAELMRLTHLANVASAALGRPVGL